jgi:hypothetical protein
MVLQQPRQLPLCSIETDGYIGRFLQGQIGEGGCLRDHFTFVSPLKY